MGYSIAIDGPAGAGKSTIAKKVSKELSFIYVDTGALYRALAFHFLEQNIDPEDETAISEACKNITVGIKFENGEQQVYLNGKNVTDSLRREEVGKMASVTSAVKEVRAKLLDLQRDLAKKEDVIMDGRDIGTFVLPDADLKIYLTASSRARALRRYAELKEKGTSATLEEVEQDIVERDERDMTRAIAPLKQADDAVLVDTSDMTIEQVITRLTDLYKENKQ